MTLDTNYSGSTCVSVMTIGRKLYMANVGDSRGIVIQSVPGSSTECTCEALTRDHKPEDKDEADRIIKNGGRVDSYRDHNG